MAAGASYLVPAATVRAEQEIKRSRFIATVGRASDRTAAMELIERVKGEFPDARHHCWAYVAGGPHDGADVGFSDAGEPKGTAGKPILNVLLHKGIGEITAVVTRYFGGIKLGTGGLVRAYSSSVQRALETLPLTEHVEMTSLAIAVPYSMESSIRNLATRYAFSIEGVTYGEAVSMQLGVPRDLVEEISGKIREVCQGEVHFS
ncbi:MAG: YigZ family protein [Deltaproteobacteria bacterium]|nr:MAG: YigZ family protein [Deltaproteobacteria bacterium]